MSAYYLIYLSGTDADFASAKAAFQLAKSTSARVGCMFPRPDPAELVPFVGDGVPGLVVDEVISNANKAADAALGRSREMVAQAAKALDFVPPGGGEVPISSLSGRTFDVLSNAVLLTDLVFFPSTEDMPGQSLQPRIEHVLLTARRPVLMTKSEHAKSLPGKVVVLWDGGPEAATAVLRAQPILKGAEQIDVVHVKTEASATSASDLTHFLGQGGLQAKPHDIEGDHQPVYQCVFDHVSRLQPDLVVMGAYGHNRLLELVLGGVTRHFLSALPCPVFMAH